MNKLALLRQHLIDSPLKLMESNLEIYATSGGVRSPNGEHNKDFELQYTAHILIRNYPADPDALVYLVLRWLEQYQPDHTENPIQFEADILDRRSADIYLAIPFTETITVTAVEGGVELTHQDDPNVATVYLDAADWQLYTLNDGEEELVAEWLQGP